MEFEQKRNDVCCMFTEVDGKMCYISHRFGLYLWTAGRQFNKSTKFVWHNKYQTTCSTYNDVQYSVTYTNWRKPHQPDFWRPCTIRYDELF